METENKPQIVLFVCTGNTCRSPMAEAWCNELLRKAGVRGWRARSAGVSAMPGCRASLAARKALANCGCEALEQFVSRPLDAAMAAEAALIVPMTLGHQAALLSRFPEAAAKVKKLLDFAGGGDVGDPYGGDLTDYLTCFETMRPALEALVRQLADQAGND